MKALLMEGRLKGALGGEVLMQQLRNKNRDHCREAP